jgi:hypothetical protein
MWEVRHLVGCEADSPLRWHDWTFTRVGGLDERARTLADPAIRSQISPLVRQAQAKDIEAIGHIERVLRAEVNTECVHCNEISQQNFRLIKS